MAETSPPIPENRSRSTAIMLQFDQSRFLPIDDLVKKKNASKTSISVVIPTLNEAATIGEIVLSAKKSLMEDALLVDEIIVMDSRSTDSTMEIARDAVARALRSMKLPISRKSRRERGSPSGNRFLPHGAISLFALTRTSSILRRILFTG